MVYVAGMSPAGWWRSRCLYALWWGQTDRAAVSEVFVTRVGRRRRRRRKRRKRRRKRGGRDGEEEGKGGKEERKKMKVMIMVVVVPKTR